jgi:hypothetical protein
LRREELLLKVDLKRPYSNPGVPVDFNPQEVLRIDLCYCEGRLWAYPLSDGWETTSKNGRTRTVMRKAGDAEKRGPTATYGDKK